MKKLFLLILVTALCKLHAETSRPENYIVNKTDQPLKIDGKLNDEAWALAAPSPIFADIITGKPARYPAKCRMLWDNNMLYFGFEIDEPNVWANKSVRDDPMGIKGESYKENFVKIYLDPDGDGKNYIEMHVNPLNKICDKWQTAPWYENTRKRMGIKENAVQHPEWNCPGLLTATHTQGTLNDSYDIDNGWTVEVAIPFTSLKRFAGQKSCPPENGDTWKAHLGRRYQKDKMTVKKDVQYWTWPIMGIRNCHEPDRWGTIEFRERTNAAIRSLPKASFKWKAIWAHQTYLKTPEQIRNTLDTVKKMGFNVFIPMVLGSRGKCFYNSKILNKPKNVNIDTLAEIIKEAKKRNIQVYAWFVNLVNPTKEFVKNNPQLLQKIQPWETQSIKQPRANPDRNNAHGGNWLCPDHGLTEWERNLITELMTGYELDGLALDYIGYRNYYACFCEHSVRERANFTKANPQLNANQILKSYSEQSMVNYTKQIRDLALGIKPAAKLAIHIYPDFDLNPLYAAKLPVDYCGETVAWFYKPFWSLGKVSDLCRSYKAEEGKYCSFNKFIPFIGVYSGDRLKSPERLRREIRLAGSVNPEGIMVAFYDTFEKHPELVKLVSEELK